MGRWMEILRKRPPDGATPSEHSGDILGEIAPHPLLCAATRMPKAVRNQFPLLSQAGHFGMYRDEVQILSPEEVERLLNEFLFLRQLCRRQAFLRGFDVDTFLAFWREENDVPRFEEWVDKIEALLRLAAREKAWVKLLL